jgi:hypothetical protein
VKRRATLAILLVACGSLATTNAHAQASSDKAAADALFKQARALMLEGKYADACPKFAESQRLDAGLGTMLRLADCYEKLGRTASAWSTFRAAADLAGRTKDPREVVARRHAKELEPKLPSLVITLAPNADVPNLEVQRDGERVASTALGSPSYVDPGTHVVFAHAPGKKPWTRQITATATSGATKVEIPVLDVDPATVTASPAPPPTTTTARSTQAEPPPPASNTQRTIGLVVAGVGVGGVALGSFFGLSAKSSLDASNADGHCRPDNHCDAVGKEHRDDFERNATLSTIFFIAGGVALAGGAVLYFTAPKSTSIAIAPTQKGASIVFRTAW